MAGPLLKPPGLGTASSPGGRGRGLRSGFWVVLGGQLLRLVLPPRAAPRGAPGHSPGLGADSGPGSLEATLGAAFERPGPCVWLTLHEQQRWLLPRGRPDLRHPAPPCGGPGAPRTAIPAGRGVLVRGKRVRAAVVSHCWVPRSGLEGPGALPPWEARGPWGSESPPTVLGTPTAAREAPPHCPRAPNLRTALRPGPEPGSHSTGPGPHGAPKVWEVVGGGPQKPAGPSRRWTQGGCGVPGLRGLQVTPGGREAHAAWAQEGPALGIPSTRLGPPSPHLEPDAALLTTQTGQHEGDDSEEPGEGHGHHSQGGRPGELAEGGAVCRGRGGYRGSSPGPTPLPPRPPGPLPPAPGPPHLPPTGSAGAHAATAARTRSSRNGHGAPLWPQSEDAEQRLMGH